MMAQRAEDQVFLDYLGIDAERWAAEFCKAARDHGARLDEGWVTTWFAAALGAGPADSLSEVTFISPEEFAEG